MIDAWLGIDWSGSKAARLPGIQVAEALPGNGPPRLLRGPRAGGLWRRADVLDLLRTRLAQGQRVLAGFDFAFAYARADEGSYFPGVEGAPDDVRSLWAFVDRLSGNAADLYGGAVYGPGSPVADLYLTPAGRGARYRHRRRCTEVACATITSPHPVFKCVGAANVGTGSLAGMRLLHRLDGQVAVWPFDAPAALTVVEIFPRLYFKRAGADPRAWRDATVVDAALAAHGSAPYSGPALDTEDEADAVVAAAALRALSAEPAVWAAPSAEPAARWEGWIFGVDSAKPGAP